MNNQIKEALDHAERAHGATQTGRCIFCSINYPESGSVLCDSCQDHEDRKREMRRLR